MTSSSKTATTFQVSDNTPEKHQNLTRNGDIIGSHQGQIKNLRQYRENNCSKLLQTSEFPSRSFMSDNGFVRTVMQCYNSHHNLILRPDDIWAAIMTQFSFYIIKHAEEFPKKFVNCKGKRMLTVTTAPYDTFVKLMSKEIGRNLVDPEMKKWILPSFSTTTDNDLVTICVVFMASMKKYFDHRFCFLCGIPQVTLEGTPEDWKEIHHRLGKLQEYKLEKWYKMLEPVLQEFIAAKEGRADVDFWQRICHFQRLGSGTTVMSGWITAFCVFDEDGNWQGEQDEDDDDGHTSSSSLKWPKLDTKAIPTGIVEVDVKIEDKYDSVMFAGHMGAEIKEDGCTVQPVLGWCIALKSK